MAIYKRERITEPEQCIPIADAGKVAVHYRNTPRAADLPGNRLLALMTRCVVGLLVMPE